MNHPVFNECSSYFQSLVLDVVQNSGWVAGGAVRDWFVHRKITSDVDVWFPDEPSLLKAKSLCEEAGWKLTKESGASINFRTSKGRWVQLVKKHFFTDMQSTIDAFDFTVCCAATDGKQVISHDGFFVDLAMKRLAFNRILYPVSTWKRCAKYMEKGFKLCPDEQKKLLVALQEELSTLTIEQADERYME